MKFVLIFLCCMIATLAFAQDEEQVWKSFKLSHKKTFSSAQKDLTRKKLFLKSKKLVDDHNKRYKENKESYELKLNEWSDLSIQEFRKLRTGRRPDLDINLATTIKAKQSTIIPATNLPLAFDWRTKGVVTSVKDQSSCGSCYCFSTTAHLESQYSLKHGKLVDFSPQQCVDCSNDYGNGGCKGGLERYFLNYVKDNGIQTLSSYPYNAVDGSCKYNRNYVATKIANYTLYEQPSNEQLKTLLVQNGPPTVAMCASHEKFLQYSKGIFDDLECPSEMAYMDHSVLLVGYGNENGKNYWILKNSWGSNWGENGYFRVSTDNNICGIRTDVCMATIA